MEIFTQLMNKTGHCKEQVLSLRCARLSYLNAVHFRSVFNRYSLFFYSYCSASVSTSAYQPQYGVISCGMESITTRSEEATVQSLR